MQIRREVSNCMSIFFAWITDFRRNIKKFDIIYENIFVIEFVRMFESLDCDIQFHVRTCEEHIRFVCKIYRIQLKVIRSFSNSQSYCCCKIKSFAFESLAKHIQNYIRIDEKRIDSRNRMRSNKMQTMQAEFQLQQWIIWAYSQSWNFEICRKLSSLDQCTRFSMRNREDIIRSAQNFSSEITENRCSKILNRQFTSLDRYSQISMWSEEEVSNQWFDRSVCCIIAFATSRN